MLKTQFSSEWVFKAILLWDQHKRENGNEKRLWVKNKIFSCSIVMLKMLPLNIKSTSVRCCWRTYQAVLPAVCHSPLRRLSLLPCHIYSQPAPPVHYPMSRFLSGSTCTKQTNHIYIFVHRKSLFFRILCEQTKIQKHDPMFVCSLKVSWIRLI